MSKRYRVNVYENEMSVFDPGQIIARVNYNEILDYWDGQNWSNGGIGKHLGLTKLRDGRYVLIVGSQWVGSQDYAYVISKYEALQEILSSQNLELLKTKKFAELNELYKEHMILEEDDFIEEI